ncbi:hypothetical protein IQ26_04718 [Mesorhizobium tianshanense]|uniref:Uncharacterized protein n=1 Tax=Mesorhizobium tianshanense TaxID=39844 RepID=A0A562NG35_9HYPH|nr:hypothetical protein IQ26_04718 [Mesorhizobium tianshanense]
MRRVLSRSSPPPASAPISRETLARVGKAANLDLVFAKNCAAVRLYSAEA